MTCNICGEPVIVDQMVKAAGGRPAHRACLEKIRAQIHAARTRPTTKADLGLMDRCSRCGYPDAGGLCDLDGEAVCYGCLLIARGLSPFEGHHVVGRKNSDEVVDVPANLHHYLNQRQREWPKSLEANVTRDPLLAIAANVSAYRDFAAYAATYFGAFASELVGLRCWLVEQFGELWWEHTDLQAMWTQRKPVPGADSTGVHQMSDGDYARVQATQQYKRLSHD